MNAARDPGATWVVGDVHGCAEELDDLLAAIAPGPCDRVLFVGDLFHRGPDPLGVFDRIRALPRAGVVLGNHELALLRRLGLAGERGDQADAAPAEAVAGLDPTAPGALLGDRRARIAPAFAERADEVLAWLVGTPCFLEGSTRGGRSWLVVHGAPPAGPLATAPAGAFVRLRGRDDRPGSPPWYLHHAAPPFVAFGHRASAAGPHPAPTAPTSWGLDTGCVYGGVLTALELDGLETVAVPARRAWVRRR